MVSASPTVLELPTMKKKKLCSCRRSDPSLYFNVILWCYFTGGVLLSHRASI